MRFFDNMLNPDAYYEPNSFGGPQQDGAFTDLPLDLHGPAARFDHRDGSDDFSQPCALFMLFDDAQKDRLFASIAAAMRGVPAGITERQIDIFRRVHPDFGAGVCASLDALDLQF